jgi:CheY-like chemotaxis protein
VPPPRDLAGALHEVSNALTVVLGWIERARQGAHSPVDVEAALDVAVSRASQARDIVRRAIGAEVQEDGPVSGAQVVVDAMLGLEPEMRRAGLQVITEVDADAESALLADCSLVLQILTNLLLNAIDVSPRGALVRLDARVRAHGGGRYLVFGVEDQGPGVPTERRPTLFDASVTTRKGGAGIGLRYSASVARASGGELALVDTATGARFELRWPALPPTVHSSRRPPAPAPSRRRRSLEGTRILILEDDGAVVDLLDTALTARGADVVSISESAELEAALEKGPFDAALFDISPIQKDIEGALGAVRRKSADVRVVVISGSAENMPALPASWVSAWVRKPFEIGEIIDALAARTRRG